MWERAGLTRNDPGDQRRDEREESADAGKRWMQARGGREGENMKIIRVAGGVGSGKSQVLSILKEEYNAHVILADEVAKRLMEPNEMISPRGIAPISVRKKSCTVFRKPSFRAETTV